MSGGSRRRGTTLMLEVLFDIRRGVAYASELLEDEVGEEEEDDDA